MELPYGDILVRNVMQESTTPVSSVTNQTIREGIDYRDIRILPFVFYIFLPR